MWTEGTSQPGLLKGWGRIGENMAKHKDNICNILEVAPFISHSKDTHNTGAAPEDKEERKVCPGGTASSQMLQRVKAFHMAMKSKGSIQPLINYFIQR